MVHQKRLSAPSAYKLARKVHPYVPVVRGPHSNRSSIPLGVVIRDILGLVGTLREVRKVLANGDVEVNGRKRKDVRYGAGFGDVIGIPTLKQWYRVSWSRQGLVLISIDQKESTRKISKVVGVTQLGKKRFQVHCEDGSNHIMDKSPGVGGSILLSLPGFKQEKHLAFEKGRMALITGGKRRGTVAEVYGIETVEGSRRRIVTLGKKGEIVTIAEYVLIIGGSSAEVSVHA